MNDNGDVNNVEFENIKGRRCGKCKQVEHYTRTYQN